MAENVKIIDSKKFLWDRRIYESQEKANEVLKNYEKEGFEVRMIQEEGKYLLYTRRVAVQQSA